MNWRDLILTIWLAAALFALTCAGLWWVRVVRDGNGRSLNPLAPISEALK